MALSISRENYLLHKIHSLTGIVPVGFYMVQHLTLNSFTLAGPERFNGVIEFFEGIPKHILLAMEVLVIWLPLLFHAVYGLFIAGRAQPNMFNEKYGWSQNRMYSFQRWTGIFLFLFLIYHVSSTTVVKYFKGTAEPILYDAWQHNLTSNYYILFAFYLIGILAASYHLAYGIWNFCIRWGITISEKAQLSVQKFSLVAFIALTLLGWGALFGFLIHKTDGESGAVQVKNSAASQLPISG